MRREAMFAFAALAAAALAFAGCAPKSAPPEPDPSAGEKPAPYTAEFAASGGEYPMLAPAPDPKREAEYLARRLRDEVARATACAGTAKVKILRGDSPDTIRGYEYACEPRRGARVEGSGSIAIRSPSPHVYVADLIPSKKYRVLGLTREEAEPYTVHPHPASPWKVYHPDPSEKEWVVDPMAPKGAE